MLPSPQPRRALLASLLLMPVAAFAVFPSAPLPPGLVFALTYGRCLALLAAAASAYALSRSPALRAQKPLAFSPTGRHWFVAWLLALSIFLMLVPAHRWSGASLVGDEPKYLRMTESLYHDLDVDIGSETQQDPDAQAFRRNLRSFGAALSESLGDLISPSGEPRSTHQNWTIEGQHGGRYYVQSPGLPALLLPAVALQRTLAPGSAQPWLPLVMLAMLWAAALVQTARLASELGGSPLASLAAASLALASPPLLIGGMHFYPEAVAVALVPWIARFVRSEGPTLGTAHITGIGTARLLTLGAALGTLPWFHPKFLPVALVLALLLLIRIRHDKRGITLVSVAGLVPFLALLLFDRHITGHLRPDAFYLVYGSDVYAGAGTLLSPRLATGFVNALFAARDGILVMAPVLIAGVLALPNFWRKRRYDVVVLTAVFAATWFAAAVHDGGAPGPPARLMAPAAPLLAVPLALAWSRFRSHPSLPFRWTAVALALITLSMTLSFRTDWLRTVNPYRGVPLQANFAPDLPDGPRDLTLSPPESRRPFDLARGFVLVALLTFSSQLLWRRNPPVPYVHSVSLWPPIRNLHLAWWLTITALAVLFHTLP
jgi:hypothetical protein